MRLFFLFKIFFLSPDRLCIPDHPGFQYTLTAAWRIEQNTRKITTVENCTPSPRVWASDRNYTKGQGRIIMKILLAVKRACPNKNYFLVPWVAGRCLWTGGEEWKAKRRLISTKVGWFFVSPFSIACGCCASRRVWVMGLFYMYVCIVANPQGAIQR